MNINDENYIYYLIGKNLKRIRKEKKLKQREVAELCNYGEGFIANLESPAYLQTVSIGALYHISKVLNFDIREFFKP